RRTPHRTLKRSTPGGKRRPLLRVSCPGPWATRPGLSVEPGAQASAPSDLGLQPCHLPLQVDEQLAEHADRPLRGIFGGQPAARPRQVAHGTLLHRTRLRMIADGEGAGYFVSYTGAMWPRATVFAVMLKPITAAVASAGTSSFSTLRACTVNTYRCGQPGGGAAPPYSLAPKSLRPCLAPAGRPLNSGPVPAPVGSSVTVAGM